MRFFIIHLKDKAGNRVDYMTGEKKCAELVEKYENVTMYLHKHGFTQVGRENAPQATTEAQERFCATCGEKMEIKTGTSKKTGKPWKGWFCSVKEHDPIWVK